MKKYSLTIHDMTGDDVIDTMTRLNPDIETSLTPQITEPIVKTALPSHFTEPDVIDTPEPQTVVDARVDAEIDAGTANPEYSDLDATGIPWDVRIHTSTKTQTQKGFWKRKPRVEDDVFDAIVAELQDETTPEFPTGIQAPVPHLMAEANPAPPIPAHANIPPPPVAAAEVVPTVRDYTGLMNKIQRDFIDGIVEATYGQTIVDRVNAGFGTNVPTIVDIGANAEMVDYAWQCVDVDTKARAA